MRSAAEPWNGAFIAIRSAFARTLWLRSWRPGIGRTRPKIVSVPPGRARLLEDRVEAGPDLREPLEVGGDELLRLGARDAELRRERERPHAVEDAEVDRLGAAALVRA